MICSFFMRLLCYRYCTIILFCSFMLLFLYSWRRPCGPYFSPLLRLVTLLYAFHPSQLRPASCTFQILDSNKFESLLFVVYTYPYILGRYIYLCVNIYPHVSVIIIIIIIIKLLLACTGIKASVI